MHNKGAVCYLFFPKFAKSGGVGIFTSGPPAGYGPEGESFVLTRTPDISVFQPQGKGLQTR